MDEYSIPYESMDAVTYAYFILEPGMLMKFGRSMNWLWQEATRNLKKIILHFFNNTTLLEYGDN